jgi:GNAT superfamily N-acetyltransferase
VPAINTEGLTVLRLTAERAAIRQWAEPVAAVTRLAYAGSDPVPGLPPPDGAGDTARDVASELRNGAVAWLALRPDGVPAGAVRVWDHGADGWEISRLATVPSSKHRGVGRAVLDAVERAAVTSRAPRIWLNAVIERCLPPFYARLGYEVTDHWPSPDKTLTELTMQRIPGSAARARQFPWDAVPSPPGPAICWFTVGAALWLVIEDGSAGVLGAVSAAADRLAATTMLDPCLAGVDLPCADIAEPRELLADVGDGTADVRRVANDRLSVRCHLMPRALHPGLLAFWRLPPGREANLPRGGTHHDDRAFGSERHRSRSVSPLQQSRHHQP